MVQAAVAVEVGGRGRKGFHDGIQIDLVACTCQEVLLMISINIQSILAG